MEISQLKMFKTVADSGSIIRASEILHCVPSNITTRLKHLEEELTTQLFIRKGRGLVISPNGTTFLEYVNKILYLCDEATKAVSNNTIPSGVLRIGAIESSATSRLPKLLAEYHENYPLVTLQFSTGTWPQLTKDILEHKLDCAIVAVDQNHRSIDRLKIYNEELVVIASQSLGEIKSPLDFNNKNIYMWPIGCPYRNALENWLNLHGITVQITSIASYVTILGCISAGAGISLVPKSVFEQFKGIGSICAYTLDELPQIQSYLIWNNQSHKHRAKEVFIEIFNQKKANNLR